MAWASGSSANRSESIACMLRLRPSSCCRDDQEGNPPSDDKVEGAKASVERWALEGKK